MPEGPGRYRLGMSDDGDPFSNEIGGAAPARRRRLRVALVGGVVLALVAAVGGFLVLRDDGPSYPDAWDARIEPFVKIVEKERGLTFEHPVAVRFLSDKAFEKTVRADRSDLDKDDRESIEESTSLFRAFGLISGDVDLFDAFNDATGSGTLAYYSFEDRAITVRGKELSVAVHATLVHELTHALQDQRFGISDRMEDLGKKAEDGEPTTRANALQAIVEGDAERVADLYRASLDADELAELEKAEGADTDQAMKEYEDLPQVVVALLGAPYALGQALAETVAAEDTADLDKLLKDPPPDDSVLIDPLKALGDIEDPVDLDIPSLDKGEKKVDSGQIGALMTYLMLAERIPLREALTTADAWSGDAYVGFERDGVVCARVDYAAPESAAATQLVSAFEQWIAAAPGSTATIDRHGTRVTFESCDPGTSAELTNDAATDALSLVASRSYVGSSIIQSGGTAKVAACFSRKVVDEYSVEQLQDPEFGADDPAVTARIQELALGCR